MWRRDFLFWAVCLLAAGLLAGSLWRLPQPRPGDAGFFALSAGRTEAATSGDRYDETLAALNDAFRQHWQGAGVEPAPPADDLTLARRLSLALVGTVPSLEELRAAEQLPPERRAAWWVDYLLADRRFADYWAERLARVYVGNDMGPFLVFRRGRFTRWLSDQLATNRPYDELVREMLASEGIWTGKPAANFITSAAQAEGNNHPDAIRLAGRTARAFLAMRIDCLQCHDDKLGNVLVGPPDDLRSGTQATFHELAAFFGSTEISLVGVHEGDDPYRYKYLGASAETVVRPQVPFGADYFRGHGSRREQLAQWVTHPNNKPFARATVNRVWALLFGKPLVEPIDDIPLAGEYPPGMELLAADFAQHHDLQRLIRLIAASEPFRRDSRADFEITPQHEAAWAAFPLSRLRPEQISGSLIQAASLKTINGQAHLVWRLVKFAETRDFVERYGDLGQDEFAASGSTIPQRLLLMNGKLVKERTKPNPLLAATTRIALLGRSAEQQVEAAYLTVLTRRPSAEELDHFAARLADTPRKKEDEALEDLYWTLINSTEFSWNH
jgi:hypothetical protein